VPEAIEDARRNAEINHIDRADFLAGDMKEVFTAELIARYGKPDVLITDPPRSGMHADVVNMIHHIAPRKIVYVSCNPATQARDLGLLKDAYRITQIQPVDMFPHTQHVENVVLLEINE
jgi:23S rRNA (uracil1939-C5)-methyltransferase